MGTTTLNATQRRVGYAMMGAIAGGLFWVASPGLPVGLIDRVLARVAAGPPRDDGTPSGLRSCVACHAQAGGFGGGATYQPLDAFEPFPTRKGRPRAAMIEVVRPVGDPAPPAASLPAVPPGGVCPAGGPGRTGPANTLALFGLGLVDRIPGRALVPPGPGPRIVRAGDSEAAIPGRPRVLPYGQIGKFGWKAQYATLIDFIAATSEGEGEDLDEDEDDAARYDRLVRRGTRIREELELVGDLPRPGATPSASAADADAAGRGAAHFAAVGCVACHVPDLGELRGVYGDFLLHRLDERDDLAPAEAPPPTADPLPDEWRTPPLWGVADSAPYLHDGSAPTLEAAIARHRGDAEPVSRAYDRLAEADQRDLVAFLRTLRAPVDAGRPR